MAACLLSGLFIALPVLCLSTEITIYSISTLDDNGAGTVVGGQWLALNEINNNADILPDYHFTLKVYDSNSESQKAILAALDVVDSAERQTNTSHFPIILGCPWSSLSTASNPVLGAFHMGQISASATSIALSNTENYPYFYRTVPSDALQAEGIILLCRTFNWTSIAVVYINDAYGLYLSLGIQALATEYDIEVTSIAISEVEDLTYNYAAKQVIDLNIFIIVIVKNDITDILAKFEESGLSGFPYLYLGTDGWMDSSVIRQYNLTQKVAGSIGTIPWVPGSLSLDKYDEEIRDVLNISMSKYSTLLDLWKYHYENGQAEYLYNLPLPGTFVTYGYDAIHTLIYAMQEIENNQASYGGNLTYLLEHIDRSQFIQLLNEIIVNKTDFVGTSGHVLFNDVGDRISGLYTLGNIKDNGEIEGFGYFFENTDGTLGYKVNVEDIEWPSYFTDHGVIPRSHVLIREQVTFIDSAVFVTMIVFAGLSILITMLFIIFLAVNRGNKIMRAASWKLNVLMCVGAIIGYIAVILYGFDERQRTVDELHSWCNIRLWLLIISMTVMFMPLFAKTWRLSIVFRSVLQRVALQDVRLFLGIGCCVAIDLLLLLIFVWAHPLFRVYHKGELKTVDALQQIQYVHGSCSFDANSYKETGDTLESFYLIVVFWKACELGFGIYAALNVSRIRDITNQLARFDETGIQLLSILMAVVIMGLTMTILLVANLHGTSYYLLMSISILLVGNVVIFLNLMPRSIAVLTRKEDKYQQSQAEKIESMIKQSLRRFSGVDSSSTMKTEIGRVMPVIQ